MNEDIMTDIVKQQIDECLELLRHVINKDILGVYIFGSALIGGLQKYSDLDLFVVINRPTTQEEKSKLIESLLKISGIYMKGDKYPIEMTIVVQSAVNPWHYPPQFDFQYGEWLRESFETGKIDIDQEKEMPDLAIIITQVLLSSNTLLGDTPEQLLAEVPYLDIIKSIEHSLPSLMDTLESDTRNVLLTLARMWRTLETDTICSKPAAVDWAIPSLPKEYQPILQRAKAICIGEEKENWDDVNAFIEPCANFMLSKLEDKIAAHHLATDSNRSIRLVD